MQERKFSLFERSKSSVQGSEEPLSPTQRRSSSTVWDISDYLLTTLPSTAQSAPTPYLGTLTSVSLSTFNAIRGARENKEALKQLASLVYSLTITVTSTHKDLQSSAQPPQSTEQSVSYSNDPELNRQVENLISKFKEIKDFVEDQASRHFVRRMVASKSDLRVIQDYKDQLRNALDAFSLQSSITLRGTMSKVVSQQETMLRSQESVRSTISSLHQNVLKLNQGQTEQTQAEVQSVTTDMSALSLVSPVSERKTVSFAPSPTPLLSPSPTPSSSHDSEFGEKVDSPMITSSPTSDSSPFVFPPLDSSRASPSVDSRPLLQSNNPFLTLNSSFPPPPLSESQSVPELSTSEHQDSTSSFSHAFANASSIQGNISLNHVAGDSSHITNIDDSRSENFGNVYGNVYVIMNIGYDRRQQEVEAFNEYGPGSGTGRGADRHRQHGYGLRHGSGSMSVRGSGSVESDFHRPTTPGAYAGQRRGRWQGYPSSATALRWQGRSRMMPGPGVRGSYHYAESDHDVVGNWDSYTYGNSY